MLNLFQILEMTWQLHLLPNFTLLDVGYGSLLCLAIGTTKHPHFHILADLFLNILGAFPTQILFQAP